MGSKKLQIQGLQSKLTGAEGQVVGFDSSGNAIAQDTVQSDWFQNDSTQPDYVKNRPGGYEDYVVLAQGTYTVPENGYGGSIKQADDFYLEPYLTAEINGVKYSNLGYGEAYDSINRVPVIYIGNGSLLNDTVNSTIDDTGEDFVLFQYPQWNTDLMFQTKVGMEGTYDIEIARDMVLTFDKKYLPNDTLYFNTNGCGYSGAYLGLLENPDTGKLGADILPPPDKRTSETITLSASGWNNKSQTVSVFGVTASNDVVVAPAPSDLLLYSEHTIICTTQTDDALTFSCESTPNQDLAVNVAVYTSY